MPLIGKLVAWTRRYPSAAIALSLGVICVILGFATGFWLLFRRWTRLAICSFAGVLAIFWLMVFRPGLGSIL